MRAVLCRQLDGPGGLRVEDAPRPEPGRGEVRVRVRAAGVNFADTLLVAGRYQIKPELPFTPGMEIAGEIEALGPGVEGLDVGERVMATLAYGGFAEEVVARALDVVRVPNAVSDVAAAGLAVAYGTAHGALSWAARLAAGETLVVHGAAGGVGLAAVECGKALGARVIATARGRDKLEVARAHGADQLIDTGSEDVRERLRELTGSRGVDVVFDPVGGELFTASLRAIAWEGRIVIVGFASNDIPKIPANLLLVKNAHALGFYWGSYRAHDPERVRQSFEVLLRWQADGLIRPHVSEVLPLESAGDALQRLIDRKSTGKVVLNVD
ncbi:MAG: NADPH:quinone oxidoreductase family protein [Geminicoccaceae bacterium]|nr:NADPH:quinone oxidoreductase family protein [Geminicoccaceae bacterium]